MSMPNGLPRSVHDFGQEFAALAGEIPGSPEKRALASHGVR